MKNNNRKVSIIIPAYNAEKTIERCLKSVISQTYRNIEVIIIDDGSTDKTADIIKSINDPRIICVSNRNMGVSASRNMGIKMSTGGYIMFCDADDTYDEEAVRSLIKCAEKEDVDAIKFGIKIIRGLHIEREGMNDLSGHIINPKEGSCRARLFKGFFHGETKQNCLVMGLFIKKSIVEAGRISFDEKLYMMEDVVFYADLFNNCESIYFLDKPLYNYYINNGSVSHSRKNARRIADGIYEANVEFCKRINDPLINAAHFRAFYRCVLWNYQNTHRLESLEKAKEIAEKSDFCEMSRYWRSTGNAIINGSRMKLKILAAEWLIKEFVKNKL